MNRNNTATREWTHAVLSTVYEAIIVIDDKLRIVFANDAAATMLQTSRPLLLGHYVWKVLPIYRNDQQITEEQYRQAIATEDFSQLGGPMVLMVAQNLLLMNVTVQFLPQFRNLVFVFEDDKRIQLALEQQERKTAETSQQKIRSILESIRDAFFALDGLGHFTYINAQADPFFEGKTRRSLIGKIIWEEFPELNETQLYQQSMQALATSETQTFQEFYKHIDTWFEFQIYPARDGLSVYFRDITSAKIAEERTFVQYEITKILSETASIDEALSQVVEVVNKNLRSVKFSKENMKFSFTQGDAKLTAYLNALADQINQFIQRKLAEEQVRESEARKDEFISMASHELKTPVTSAKVFTQILQRRLQNYSDQEVPRFLTKMDGQLDKLTKLISDLLNLSKIQAGKLEFHWGEVDIDELIADTVENLQATSQRFQITLHGKVGQNIVGDRDRIGQALINLLTNAMKYSAESAVIEVTVAKQEEFAAVSVRDFGIGIAKKHQDKIFDRFYQAHKEPQNFPGLGIGLYISREIARRHGGDIKVTSKKAKGSIFTLLLPISNTFAQ